MKDQALRPVVVSCLSFDDRSRPHCDTGMITHSCVHSGELSAARGARIARAHVQTVAGDIPERRTTTGGNGAGQDKTRQHAPRTKAV